MITRRSLITGLAGLIAAPAVIRVAKLMPVKPPPIARGYHLIAGDTIWTANRTIGPFRYAVLYNDDGLHDETGDAELIAFWDYGNSVNLAPSEDFTVEFNPFRLVA